MKLPRQSKPAHQCPPPTLPSPAPPWATETWTQAARPRARTTAASQTPCRAEGRPTQGRVLAPPTPAPPGPGTGPQPARPTGAGTARRHPLAQSGRRWPGRRHPLPPRPPRSAWESYHRSRAPPCRRGSRAVVRRPRELPHPARRHWRLPPTHSLRQRVLTPGAACTAGQRRSSRCGTRWCARRRCPTATTTACHLRLPLRQLARAAGRGSRCRWVCDRLRDPVLGEEVGEREWTSEQGAWRAGGAGGGEGRRGKPRMAGILPLGASPPR